MQSPKIQQIKNMIDLIFLYKILQLLEVKPWVFELNEMSENPFVLSVR
jgi:hypothetical protein